MKNIYIIGNWKSNKSSSQTVEWFEKIAHKKDLIAKDAFKKTVICVPYLFLPLAKSLIGKYALDIHLAAQDISPFGEGAYTGAINGKQLSEYCSFVIIGHSERRQNFAETDEVLAKKVTMALANGLTPIFCVKDSETSIPAGVKIVAYEPLFAIGTGQADTPDNAERVALEIANKGIENIIYGGSVTGENVRSFTEKDHIAGVLPGKSSLDADSFVNIILNS